MKREIILDCALGETRAAVLEDGRLVELHVERGTELGQTGSLFYGRIQAVKPSMRAAFVDIGLKLNAFLPLSEPRKCGDFVIVQGEASLPTPTKGLRVTDRVTLAGRGLVLAPGDSGVRVSKKIKDEALRGELRAIGEAICPEGCGLVMRTAAAAMSERLLGEEARRLAEAWREAGRRAAGMRAPGLLRERETLELRLARDLAGTGLERIVANDASCVERLLRAQQSGDMSPDTRVELYDEGARGVLLFDAFSLEAQIDGALERRVWLPCGGYLVIDPCEAMTVIDVNSGKATPERGAEDAALRVNLEAADEAARQIRLRDIGGIVVIDFIDLRDGANRDALVARMREAVSGDRARVTVEGLTKLGLMELTRKHGDGELRQRLRAPCPRCGGTGEAPLPEETALRALREVRRKALSGQRGPFLIRCGAACAQALLRQSNPAGAPVYALAAPSMRAESFDIQQLRGGELPDGAEPLPERTDI